MKKLFTLLAAAVFALTASAEEKSLVNYPTSKDGTAISGTTAEGTVKIHSNTDAVACYSLKNGYISGGVFNNNAIILTTEGGFKAGDVLTIAGAINNSDASKRATAVLFTLNADNTANVLNTFSDFINGRLVDDDPVEESFTLEADAETLYLGRDGGTGANLTLIKVIREEQEVGPFYAVVGSDENLFGTAWNQATTTDYMKAGEDGIYTWTKQNVALSENPQLKVIKKEAKEDAEAAEWYPSDGNVSLDGWTKAANYNVTVTFNPETSAVTATAERIITIESLAIVGDFSENGWDATQGLAMTQDETKKNIWTLSIEGFQAEAKTYKYKAAANDTWDDYVLPAGDNATETLEAATYNLLFTADTEAHTLTLTAQKQSDVQIGTLYIVGEITGGWPTEATADDDGWSMAKAMTQDANDANIWTLQYNTYITVTGESLQLFYKAAADKAWDFSIPEGSNNNDYIFYESGQYNMTFTANVAEKTLTLVAEKEQAPAFAENAIYAWQSPTGYAYEQGGTATGEGDVNVANDKYYTIRLSGKNNFSTAVVTIELDENNKLQAGDQIAITAFRNKNEANKNSGAKLRFDGGNDINIGDGLAFNNINTADAVKDEFGEPNTITAAVPNAVDGATKIELTRSSTSTNLFITKIEIKQFAGYTVAGAYKVGEEDQAAFFGTAWAAGSADNDLIDNGDGTYSKTFTGVEFAEPGTIYYKVAKAHRWTESWGFDNENADYVINEPMTNCTVTFTFNPTEKLDNNYNVKCEVTGTPTAIATVSSNEAAKAIFNLAGQRVQNAQKGLYIINGKKVIK